MPVSRRKWVLAEILTASGALVVTAFPPLAAADGGDDFSNNLFSDLAPILALFGEQVAKQFMSQSMGWADNILFAMAPLGVITAIVGAIRVAGPPILKVIVGRARENRVAAEIDLMSSTSHDVCELWNGQMVVRMMGSPTILELIFLPGRKGEWDCGLATLEEHTQWLVPCGPRHHDQVMRDEPDAEAATLRDEGARDTGRARRPPNIFLNLYFAGSRRTLRLLAGFAIVLQLSVLVYSGFVSIWLKLGKGGRVVPYGYPLTATGTVLLVIGMLICSHVVEQSTAEHAWDIRPDPATPGPRILWLQQGGNINDQKFSSFFISGRGRCGSILTSQQRKGPGGYGTLIWLYYLLRQRFDSSWKRSNTSVEKYLEYLVVVGTLTSIFGFIIQFIGLRSMHWSASIAQLAATVIMIFIRALVRLGIATPPLTQRIPEGNELDWLATMIGDNMDRFWTSLDKPKQSGDFPEALGGFLDENICSWNVVTGVGMDKFSSLHSNQLDGGLNDVVRIRKRLSKLSDWTRPLSKFAISVAGSVEAVMNTIITQEEYPGLETFSWSIYGVYGHGGGGRPGKIDFKVLRGEDKRWVASPDEVEAVLSLWLYSMQENNTSIIPDSTLPGGGDRLRHGKTAVQQHQYTIRLLGGNEEYYCRDIHWYLGEGVDIISQVQVEESPMFSRFSKFSTGNIVEIEERNILGFTTSGADAEMDPNHPRFRRFRTQAIRLHPCHNETTLNSSNRSGQTELYDHLAVVSYGQLELLLAQDLFSSFMWGFADMVHGLGVESTLRQPDQVHQTDSEWFDSLRLENTALSSIAREIEKAGLGRPEDAYASIIPPLSIKNKLPTPRCLVTHARERAQNHFTHGNWRRATDVYSKLLAICIAFGRASPLCIEATAVVYEGLRAARVIKCLWERWWPDHMDIEALNKQELDMQQVLRTADEQVVLNLRIMHKVQRRRAYDDEDTSYTNGHQTTTGSGSGIPPGDDITGFSERDKDFLHLTELHCAVIAGDRPQVQDCLLNGANADVKDVLGWAPLHYAATQGSLEITRLLLSTAVHAGADPNIKDLAGRTALHQAGDNGHKQVVQLLLESGAYIREKNSHGSTSLHLAAQNGHASTAQVLLASGADIEPRDRFGCRPLHCAADSGHLEVVRLLLKNGADKEATNNSGGRPLHVAAGGGRLEVVRLLLDKRADAEASNNQGDTPLHIAAGKGRLEVVRLLLEEGADKEAENNQGGRPLHTAAGKGRLEVMQLLLEIGANKEAENGAGDRPLHIAAEGHLEVMQLLLEEGADKEAGNDQGDRPLHTASGKGHLEVVQLLLEIGANKEAENGAGDRPLHIAAEGHLEVMQLLLEKGADKEAENKQGLRPLHNAALNGHLEGVRLLLEKGADKEAEGTDRERPLHSAARKGHLEVVRLLLEEGVDKEAGNERGFRPLHIVVGEGRLEAMRLLLEKGADAEAENNQGDRPLHIAAEGHLGMMQLLLEKGVDKEAENNEGNRPLHIAAGKGHLEVVRLLLEKGADKEAENERGFRPLHTAAGEGRLEVVLLLLENGADMEAESNQGDRPLHIAAERHLGMVQLLLGKGADEEAENNEGNRPLHIAAGKGNLDVVRLLLQKGADIGAENERGFRPLHTAAGEGHLEVVRLLLENGADMEAESNQGDRPLHIAAERHLGMVQLLLEKGADKEAENNEGNRPLHIAADKGLPELVRLLLENGADKGAKNKRGLNPRLIPLHPVLGEGKLH